MLIDSVNRAQTMKSVAFGRISPAMTLGKAGAEAAKEVFELGQPDVAIVKRGDYRGDDRDYQVHTGLDAICLYTDTFIPAENIRFLTKPPRP